MVMVSISVSRSDRCQVSEEGVVFGVFQYFLGTDNSPPLSLSLLALMPPYRQSRHKRSLNVKYDRALEQHRLPRASPVLRQTHAVKASRQQQRQALFDHLGLTGIDAAPAASTDFGLLRRYSSNVGMAFVLTLSLPRSGYTILCARITQQAATRAFLATTGSTHLTPAPRFPPSLRFLSGGHRTVYSPATACLSRWKREGGEHRTTG